MSKPKDSGTGDSTNALAKAQDNALKALQQGKQEGFNFLDYGRAQALENINPLIPASSQVMQGVMGNLANFNNLANQETTRAQQAYANPARRGVEEGLKNLYARYGVGGNNNSRSQNMMARFADETAFNDAQRRYQLERDVRNNLLSEQGNLYQLGSQPVMYKSGVDLDINKSKANTAVGVGSQIGNTYESMGRSMADSIAQENARKQQRSDAKKGQWGQLAGAGLGGATSIAGSLAGAGAFSDGRLKENIRKVGKLKNGFNVYAYNFKGSPRTEIGLIAQEVMLTKPNAVIKDSESGYLKVNYEEATK